MPLLRFHQMSLQHILKEIITILLLLVYHEHVLILKGKLYLRRINLLLELAENLGDRIRTNNHDSLGGYFLVLRLRLAIYILIE